MNRQLEWVKRDYCRLKGVNPSREIEILEQGRTADNDFMFTVNEKGQESVGFTLDKVSLTPYSKFAPLTLDPEYKNKPALLTKETICRWFNSKTGLGLLPEDINNFVVRTDRVTVVSSVNSMRFKHTFYMQFK